MAAVLMERHGRIVSGDARGNPHGDCLAVVSRLLYFALPCVSIHLGCARSSVG